MEKGFYRAVRTDGGDLTVTRACECCGSERSVRVDGSRFYRWLGGERDLHVQDFWPDLSPEDREFLFISGVCPDCWNGMFGREGGDEGKLS